MFLCALLVLVLSLCLLEVSSFYNVEYVGSRCGQTIYVTSATKLELESYMFAYFTNNKCEVTLKALDSFHFNLNLDAVFKNIDLDCDSGSVSIYSQDDGGMRTALATGICGYKPTSIFDATEETLVVVVTKTDEDYASGSFNLLFTESHNGICDNTEFACNNNFKCIDDILTCDGNDNCGDNSDEGTVCFWSVGVISGVAIGSTVFITLLIIILVVACRRKQRIIYNNQCGAMPYTNGPTVIAQPYYVMPQPQYGTAATPGYQQGPPTYQQTQQTAKETPKA